jgi:hypothetical protein
MSLLRGEIVLSTNTGMKNREFYDDFKNVIIIQ